MPVIPGPSTPTPPLDGAWLDVDALPCDLGEADPALALQVIVAASQILNDMVGGRYPGPRTDKIWPSLDAECGCPAWSRWARALPGDRFTIVGDDRRCGTPRQRVGLHTPVREILEVTIDGEVVDPAEYRVLDNQWLIGLDGRVWPSCQRHDSTDPDGTFSVEYSYGASPPAGGVLAAGSLSCELMRMFGVIEDEGPCRLGKVTSVNRQGVSKAVNELDPSKLFPEGLTGLPEVDAWVSATNGAPSRAGGSFMDPARRRRGHRR